MREEGAAAPLGALNWTTTQVLGCYSQDPCPQTPEKSPLQGERGLGGREQSGRGDGARLEACRPIPPRTPALPHFESGVCFLKFHISSAPLTLPEGEPHGGRRARVPSRAAAGTGGAGSQGGGCRRDVSRTNGNPPPTGPPQSCPRRPRNRPGRRGPTPAPSSSGPLCSPNPSGRPNTTL